MLKSLKSKIKCDTILLKLIIFIVFLPASWPRQYYSIGRDNDTGIIFLVRSTSSDVNSLFFSGEDLYDNTMESLQWLIPTDIHRLNVFSPQSAYQINMRYRNDPSVKRYFGYQLWKLHETDVTNKQLNLFWRLFG